MTWFVGIDWANDSNQVELQNGDGEVVFNDSYEAGHETLYALRDELLEKAQSPEDICVAIEDPTRPVTRVLLDAGMQVFVMTPRKLDAVRSAYAESGAKNDVLDAHVLCDELRVHRNLFYRLVPQQPVIATLSQYYRALEEAKGEVNRFANRLRERLRGYFPQFLQLDWALDSRVMLELFELVPSSEAAEEVSVEAVDEVLGRCRKHTAREVLDILTSGASPLDERTAESAADIAKTTVKHLRFAVEAENRWDTKLKKLLTEISQKQKTGQLPSAGATTDCEDAKKSVSDVEIALSTHGLGPRCVAGLFAEGFQAIASQDRQLLRRQSIAPVTKQTGRQSSGNDGPSPFVHRRHARNRYLNDTMHQIGNCLQRGNDHYRGQYVEMKDERNHTHGRACRQVTDQYLRVFFAMLRDRTTYDANLHGATRR